MYVYYYLSAEQGCLTWKKYSDRHSSKAWAYRHAKKSCLLFISGAETYCSQFCS